MSCLGLSNIYYHETVVTVVASSTLSIHLFINLFIYVFIYLFICSLICLFMILFSFDSADLKLVSQKNTVIKIAMAETQVS